MDIEDLVTALENKINKKGAEVELLCYGESTLYGTKNGIQLLGLELLKSTFINDPHIACDAIKNLQTEKSELVIDHIVFDRETIGFLSS